ncbi:MAG: response regulator receiver protein [Candidatus Omnitrophica bacterium CG07_land_8_20_14_0_80_42_15]|uniref:Response regulator receiver protein n=1 Tax=Candidatus Aquitaenariimonas noxiae TaxID=1974741 RepID=A0A2J0L5R4_9BACT|nr:MAG: response regulator receiver protein [Candidatus Omnitrophica bacterium CG07_land_8_20_14_0_80_42_15]
MKKVLIIDDEKDFCFLIKDTLEITGKYKVIVATDGKNGIKAALEHSPDLILLDIMMPVIDGFKVLELIKGNDKIQSIPVLMLTAKGDDESKVKAAGLYDEDYLVKPIEMLTLRSKIERALSKKM